MEFAPVEEAVATLEKASRELRAELLFPHQVKQCFDLVVKGERHLAAMRTALSSRLAETQVWKCEGFASPEAFVAAATGTSYGQARGTIETGRRLVRQPAVDEEFRAGLLSPEQAREVAEAAEADPASTDELLALAREGTLSQVREKARDVKAKAQADALGAYEALRAARSHRSFVDRQGMVRGEYAFPPDEGAAFGAVHAEETRRLLRRAARNRVDLTPDQASADALFNLVTGKAKVRGSTTPKVVYRIDLDAYRRGCVRANEVCEIKGVGPVPVEVVKEVIERDAFVAAVVADGTELKMAKNFGRHLSAEMRTALEWAYAECSIEGCDVTWGLEYDHWETDYVKSKVTGFTEVAPLCGPHHDLKTYRGYRLVGEPGRFRLVPPDDTDARQGEGRDPP